MARILSGGNIRLWLLCCMLLAETVSADKGIFAAGERGVFQIRVVHQETGRKAVIGSGFLAGRGDKVVTNYHVVSRYIAKPDSYRIDIVTNDDAPLVGQLLGIDVVRDLAVLRVPYSLGRPFDLADPPAKGGRLFSMGNPLDLGLTLSESTNNGLLTQSEPHRLLLSGTLNPGMSGGPTFDQFGRVVGVNVAISGDELSLIIPGQYARDLVHRVEAANYQVPQSFQTYIATQVHDYLQRRLKTWASTLPASAPLRRFSVPASFDDSIRCWDNSRRSKPDDLFTQLGVNCELKSSIFVSSELNMGELYYEYISIASDKMDPLRFQKFYERNNSSQLHRTKPTRNSHTLSACTTDFVRLGGQPFKSTICRRDYKKYPGLSDLLFTAALVGAGREGLLINVDLIGVPASPALDLLSHMMEQIAWNR